MRIDVCIKHDSFIATSKWNLTISGVNFDTRYAENSEKQQHKSSKGGCHPWPCAVAHLYIGTKVPKHLAMRIQVTRSPHALQLPTAAVTDNTQVQARKQLAARIICMSFLCLWCSCECTWGQAEHIFIWPKIHLLPLKSHCYTILWNGISGAKSMPWKKLAQTKHSRKEYEMQLEVGSTARPQPHQSEILHFSIEFTYERYVEFKSCETNASERRTIRGFLWRRANSANECEFISKQITCL